MTKGRNVEFSITGTDKIFKASIMATESFIEANTRSLKVRALVSGNQKELVAGGFANVALEFGKTDQSIVIPTQSVIPQARDKKK